MAFLLLFDSVMYNGHVETNLHHNSTVPLEKTRVKPAYVLAALLAKKNLWSTSTKIYLFIYSITFNSYLIRMA